MKKKARDSIDRIGAFARSQKVTATQDTIETESSIADSIAGYAEKASVQIIVVGIRGLKQLRSLRRGKHRIQAGE